MCLVQIDVCFEYKIQWIEDLVQKENVKYQFFDIDNILN